MVTSDLLKGLVAVLIVVGSFSLIGIDVAQGKPIDAVTVAIALGPLSTVVGFYFGHQNGRVEALTDRARVLVDQAAEANATLAARAGVGPSDVAHG